MDMTPQYRAELKALKKQGKALVRERKTIASNCTRARKKITRERRVALSVIHRDCAAAERSVVRDEQRADKRLHREHRDIAARIAILEGRLS